MSQESRLVLKMLLVDTSFTYLIFVIKLRLTFLRVSANQWVAHSDPKCQLLVSY